MANYEVDHCLGLLHALCAPSADCGDDAFLLVRGQAGMFDDAAHLWVVVDLRRAEGVTRGHHRHGHVDVECFRDRPDAGDREATLAGQPAEQR